MRITKNFSLSELVASDTATDANIDNTPTEEHIENMKNLCEKILQPVRDHFKLPLRVSSGYRCSDLNKLVGGVENSAHKTGRAADIVLDYVTVKELFNYIARSNLPFNQLILEYDSWVHVSIPKNGIDPKRECLVINKKGTFKLNDAGLAL